MMNVLLVLAVMSALNATFTLPSIAGIVLSVGTAVDANVLIFERLREEQHRGLSLRLALRNAYGKAFSAILDSNMTTFITSAVPHLVRNGGSEGVWRHADHRHRRQLVHGPVRHANDLQRADGSLRRHAASQRAAGVTPMGPGAPPEHRLDGQGLDVHHVQRRSASPLA